MKPSEHKSKHVAPGERPEFVVFYTATAHYMTFAVVQVSDWTPTGAPEFEDPESADLSTNPDLSDPLMQGGIKWDGCINVTFQGDQNCVPHFCDIHGALIVERAMRAIYALAAQHVSHFDAECAGLSTPPTPGAGQQQPQEKDK